MAVLGVAFAAVLSPESMLRPSLSGELVSTLPCGEPRLSPESMLRPSLSGHGQQAFAGYGLLSPESMLRPSLSGPPCRKPLFLAGAVAGVYAPAFVERLVRVCCASTSLLLSPESMLRPSLSVFLPVLGLGSGASVAGVYAPAFVERNTLAAARRRAGALSPESMLRPSLSERHIPAVLALGRLSPESMLRPSLSEQAETGRSGRPRSVAGVYAPAFVERWDIASRTRAGCCCRRSLCSGLR